MRIWQIWSSGYLCTGMEGVPAQAECMGAMKAETFQEACDLFFALTEERQRYYSPERLTYWACTLHDNEADARRSFG